MKIVHDSHDGPVESGQSRLNHIKVIKHPRSRRSSSTTDSATQTLGGLMQSDRLPNQVPAIGRQRDQNVVNSFTSFCVQSRRAFSSSAQHSLAPLEANRISGHGVRAAGQRIERSSQWRNQCGGRFSKDHGYLTA